MYILAVHVWFCCGWVFETLYLAFMSHIAVEWYDDRRIQSIAHIGVDLDRPMRQAHWEILYRAYIISLLKLYCFISYHIRLN